MVGGYAGKIAHIDLPNQTIKIESLSENTLQTWIGGSGLASKTLYESTGPETDPFGPENCLIFMNGPFTTTRIPLSGRHEIVAKSPATNG